MDWCRLYKEFRTDPKVQQLPFDIQRHLIILFTLHIDDEISTLKKKSDIAYALNISVDELDRIKPFLLNGKFIDKNWRLRNWGKRQYSSDTSAERMRRLRERKKNQPLIQNDVTSPLRHANVTVTSPLRHCDGLDTDTDTDQKQITKVDGSSSSTEITTRQKFLTMMEPRVSNMMYQGTIDANVFRMLNEWEKEKVTPDDLQEAMNYVDTLNIKVASATYFHKPAIQFAHARIKNGNYDEAKINSKTNRIDVAAHNNRLLEKINAKLAAQLEQDELNDEK